MDTTARTVRLTLIAATAALAALEIADRETFAARLGVDVPGEWPPESVRDALPWFAARLAADPSLSGWLGWYGLWRQGENAPPVLVGSAGFFGPPTAGQVEIGYSVLPAFQNQGIATEMIDGLVRWAFAQQGVCVVAAETGSSNAPSRRVLEKLGFVPAGPGREPNDLHYERKSG